MAALRPPDALTAGSRWQGWLEPLPGEAPALPCHVLQGAQPGPTLLVSAGIHGAEYASIAAAQRLARLDPARLRGRLVVLPIVNTAAYFARSIYLNPLDGKNLNRVFPGDPHGSASERLAHWLDGTMMAAADAYLDLHGGDLIEALTPFAIHQRGHRASAAMAEAFGLPYRIEEAGEGMTFSAAHARGLPAVLAEAGGQGLWPDAAVGQLVQGSLRVLAHLGMLDGELPAGEASRLVTTFAWSRSEHAGCWYPEVSVGERVAPGQRIGTVTDLLGGTLQQPRSEVEGTVLFAVTSLAINAGDPLVGVGASTR